MASHAPSRCSIHLIFGLPQQRRRLYIIGLRDQVPIVPDTPMIMPPPIAQFLDADRAAVGTLPTGKTARRNLKKVLKKLEAQGVDHTTQTWILDIDGSAEYVQGKLNVSPTMTYARAMGFWLTSHRRRMNAQEQVRLQGFPVHDIIPLVSRTNMGRLAGNSMSVPILTHIFDVLLPQLGINAIS